MARVRVLIVDDSAFMRHALGRLLGESALVEVVGSASNGEEGLAMAKSLRPDVITLDVEMPVLDGLAMLTAMGQQAIVMDAIKRGARDFVVKPFAPDRVLAAVNKLLAA